MSTPPRSGAGSGPLVAAIVIIVTAAIALIALAATGITPQRAWDSFFPLTPVTEQGDRIKELYDIVFYIAVAIFFAVEGAIVWAVFRYRRRPGDDELPPQTHGNNLIEVIWTVIPTVIVAVLFVLSWQTLNQVDTAVAGEQQPQDVRIRANAAQFQWTFDYLDANGETVFTQNVPQGEQGGMVVPVGRSVTVSLRSPDVIHAFYVPQFLFKRDVVPGRENVFEFTVDEPGVYRGQCAELCGTFHAAMVFEVRAIDSAAYDAWLAEQVENASATPPPAPSGGAGEVVEVTAVNIAFTSGELRAPADTPFTIRFVNEDDGVPHNVEVKDAGGASLFQGEIFNGNDQRDYQVPALPAGEYEFLCTVHPNMTGTLIAE
ncbi:MAG TPA: cytochrome c oxidase subunit II [Candidatus Limnocylindrales bacterium]|nr:cytochrome c oxidase subunit II [Candidatus Limnocylindrales bacterium]